MNRHQSQAASLDEAILNADQCEALMSRSLTLSELAAVLSYNVLAVLIWFTAATLADAFYIHAEHSSVELEFLSTPVFILAVWASAAALYLANRKLFVAREWHLVLRFTFVLAEFAALYAVSFFPLLRIHMALGGQE